jgi:hypothetical protein
MTVTAIKPPTLAAALSRNGRLRQFSCDQCGRYFEPSRSDARYCSSPCRQKAYRQRQAIEAGSSFRLTAETREALRRAIDRRRRELLEERAAADRELDRELFGDDEATT